MPEGELPHQHELVSSAASKNRLLLPDEAKIITPAHLFYNSFQRTLPRTTTFATAINFYRLTICFKN